VSEYKRSRCYFNQPEGRFVLVISMRYKINFTPNTNPVAPTLAAVLITTIPVAPVIAPMIAPWAELPSLYSPAEAHELLKALPAAPPKNPDYVIRRILHDSRRCPLNPV